MTMQREPMPGPLPKVPCQCWTPSQLDDELQCQCGDAERVLRAGAPLTSEQREWCLNEIASVEGYSRADHEAESDAELGRSVLCAWIDFCRDKGLM